MTTVTHLNPASVHRSPAFSQAVRVPADHDLVVVGGQNGVGPDGAVVGPGMAEQAEQAMANVRACLAEAGADLAHVVRWTVLAVEGAPIAEGYGAFVAGWPQETPPPAVTVAVVAGLAVPGALVEIEALAAVPSGR